MRNGFQIPIRKRLGSLDRQIWRVLHAHPTMCLRSYQDHSLRPIGPARLLTSSTDITIVELHCTLKRGSISKKRTPPEFMEPRPGRLVGAEPHYPLQVLCADSTLVGGHFPDNAEPHFEGLSGSVKGCPSGHTRLPATGRTLKTPAF